ncbi:MAG: M56 family metallopeptidase, partial [Lachnospiraceae bacterium]|nr:M56 family metallopeptidase [Lachnospiraceae bacterium]
MGTVILNQLLQMNLIGIYGILLAFAVRFLLKKAGSRYCYALWIIVFFNLVLPTVLTGSFSLIPKQLYQLGLTQDDASVYETNSENDPAGDASALNGADTDYYSSLLGTDYYNLRNGAVDEVVDMTSETDLNAESGTKADTTGQFGKDGVSAMLERIWNRVASAFGGETILVRCLLIVWISVMLILFAMEGVQYRKTRRRLESMKQIGADEENRAVSLEGLETPLLFGFLHPTIYLPDHLKEEERDYILRHEMYHRRRRDHILKAVALSVSIVYWYNPLVWAAFHCFGVDMELSCDEAVLLHADRDIRKAYAGSLLKYGALQNHYVLTSLTFGEPGLKARVKHVLQFQKRGVIITVVAVLALVLLALGLLVRPSTQEEDAAVASSANDNADEKRLAEILSGLDEETYCQIVNMSGYQVLLVAENGVYDTGSVEHGTCDAMVYFPLEEQRLSAESTSCIPQYDGESIYLPQRDGSVTKYSLDADSGEMTAEEVQSAYVEVEDDVFEQEVVLSEEELAALAEISFVMRKELWTEEGGFLTQTELSETADDEDTEDDPLAHTAEMVLQFADILRELDEEDYCQILTIHGYSILLVTEATYDTSWARGSDHGTIAAEVYFPDTEKYI